MARPTALGLACALMTLVALAAGLTVVGIAGTWANNNLPSASDMPWWMIVLLAAGSLSAVFAILTILLQFSSAAMSIVTCVLGLGVHIGLLVAYTLYLAIWFTAEGYCYMTGCATSYYSGKAMYSDAYFYYDTVNAFDSWSLAWTSEMKALYVFGCAVGVFCWLVALPCAAGSLLVAKRRRAAESEMAAGLGSVDAFVSKPAAPTAPKQGQFFTDV